MLISDVTSKGNKHKRSKRVGRGRGTGLGKTCGRGHKGQGQHASHFPHPLAEGGQMPLFRRIPKRGFSNVKFQTRYQVVNIGQLDEHFDEGSKITPAVLEDKGLIRSANKPIKILGEGELTKKLDIQVTRVSTSAAMKIQKAGGQFKTAQA